LPNSDNNLKVLVNEEALRLYGIPTPEEGVGRQLTFGRNNFTIVGVIKDYYQLGAKSNMLPMIFYHDKRFRGYASIRYNNEDPQEQVAVLQAAYEEAFPGSPFEYFFLDQKYDQNYKADQQFKQIFEILTGFAILIAAMGLFGLTAFTIARRTKEIGVRKVLGASEKHIVYVLSKDFIVLVALAILVSIPLTYLTISNWLEQYANRIDVSSWLFALPALFMLALALIIVIFKTLQAASANPTLSLRSE
jgi:putative ABC transport system permease protein